ncbi:MAG: 4-vinyl reductase [Candidatus Micrarchaeota archaeon]|nr:4-vinyl reductase [Candidatus Micrarchaeota archaeon]
MAAKKSSVPKKAKQPSRAKGKARLPKAPSPSPSPLDLEGFLVHQLSRQGHSKQSSHVLPELLYNLTPSMRRLGYLSGFRAGLRLSSSHNSSNSLHPLIAALENAGFSKILYHPSKHSVVIRASHHPDCENGSNSKAHIFESGMIAGYLTESTHTSLKVAETRCVHAGSRVCQFVAESESDLDQMGAFEGVDEMIGALADSIGGKGIDGRISEGYFALQILPLTRPPVNSEISKLLYVAGERVAARTPKITDQTAEKLCALFGLRKLGLGKGRRGIVSISATLMPSNSFSGYAEMVSSFLCGMLYAKSGKVASMERRLSGDGSYTIELSI